MIISKKKYKEMWKLIFTQKETIRLLEEQCDLLKKLLKKSNFSSIYGVTATNDIDFPNSKKSYEDKIY